MNQGLMFYPALAMILLTVVVLYLMFRGRQSAVKSGALSTAYFKTYDTGEKLPRAVRQTERCFHNLLESTPPFYFLCVALISLAKVDWVFIGLAWAYVACRVLQSLVHVTNNKVGPRSKLFMLSWLVLLAMCVRLGFLIL
ncbi:MAPEG family protein [Pseudomonas sp. 2835]|uniref:MAPEG family protein n=1 Tax=Pseudomonas sp. 2835 TaxID=3156451 RepID=UPI003D20993C